MSSEEATLKSRIGRLFCGVFVGKNGIIMVYTLL